MGYAHHRTTCCLTDPYPRPEANKVHQLAVGKKRDDPVHGTLTIDPAEDGVDLPHPALLAGLSDPDTLLHPTINESDPIRRNDKLRMQWYAREQDARKKETTGGNSLTLILAHTPGGTR